MIELAFEGAPEPPNKDEWVHACRLLDIPGRVVRLTLTWQPDSGKWALPIPRSAIPHRVKGDS